jgi:hypothetical protein
MLRRIFGLKSEDFFKRKLYNGELHNLCSSPKLRRMRWAGHVARMGEKRNAYSVLVGNTERDRPLGRSRRTWEDNFKVGLGEKGWDVKDLIRLVVMNLLALQNVGKFLSNSSMTSER